ncbi:MAG: hypothetical protein HQL12_09660, partial [Candidatus Omnitrophica bacterium]|nr:hypothetical protein [Candidatus Omnitrophota bacterium]
MPRVIHNRYYYSDGSILDHRNHEKVLHRTDGPAIEYANGNKYWYLQSRYHRTDGPAVELANGDKWWYLHGQLHRADGPAVEWANGNKEW